MERKPGHAPLAQLIFIYQTLRRSVRIGIQQTSCGLSVLILGPHLHSKIEQFYSQRFLQAVSPVPRLPKFGATDLTTLNPTFDWIGLRWSFAAKVRPINHTLPVDGVSLRA